MITHHNSQVGGKVIHIILDALFPPKCAGCGVGKVRICKACAKESEYRGSECFFCGTKAGATHICLLCTKNNTLEGIFWPWRYNTKRARAIIAAYKYRKKRALARALAGELSGVLLAASLPDDLIAIPVPLHPGKLLERGFNQAGLLAECLGMPVVQDAVIRTKETPPQARAATRGEREAQVKGAFAVAREDLIREKNILIIDDVATTGATIREVAKVLKKSGAGKLYAAVIAHG